MKKNTIDRRVFIKQTVSAGAALTIAPHLAFKDRVYSYDAKGLPTRKLGKTGVKVPIMVMGTGSRFLRADMDTRLEMLEHALDNGLFYWDTASIYKVNKTDDYSEASLGRILKSRRKEVFLASKVSDREPELAKQSIENSLKRLQTDHIDLFQVHSINSLEDAQNLGKKGGLLDVLHQYREQGIIRFIGFSGHKSAEGMKYAAENYDFDTMLIAMNHWREWDGKPESQVIPVVATKGLGVIGMKLIRPKDTIEGLDVEKLIRYGLSLKHISTASVGMDSMEVLKANIQILKNFKPMKEKEMEEMRLALSPFYQHKNLEWMKPGYTDGSIA